MKGVVQLLLLSVASFLIFDGCHAFQSSSVVTTPACRRLLLESTSTALSLTLPPVFGVEEQDNNSDDGNKQCTQRRNLLQNALVGFSTLTAAAGATFIRPSPSWAEESIFAPKFVQEYEDFKQQPEGYAVRDVTIGKGDSPQVGDRVVYDWSGYSKSLERYPFVGAFVRLRQLTTINFV